jgi:hypothetical protein
MKLIHSAMAALLAFAVTTGIQGQETKKPTVVSGTVSFKGKPVTAGRVLFCGRGMRDIIIADIEDGKYVVRNIKPAEMKVTIDVDCIDVLHKQLKQRLADLEMRSQLIKSAKKENAELDKQISEMKERLKTIDKIRKDVVKVPKEYTDVETTPLKASIVEGEQTINFELKD